MVNLRRSSNAEQAEVTETFPRRERGAAEARGDPPPLRRRWVPAAVRPAHRSSGTTETQAAPAHFAVCVSVLPPDRCRAQRAHRREMRVIFSPRDSAPQRPLREIVSALSAIFASDDKVIYVSLLRGLKALNSELVRPLSLKP